MTSSTAFRWAVVSFIVLPFMAVQLEPSAFGQNSDETIARPVVSEPTPVAPSVLTSSPVPVRPSPQTRLLAEPAAATPSRKWVLIVRSIGAGVTAGILLSRHNSSDHPAGPTIFVGPPSVGQPQ